MREPLSLFVFPPSEWRRIQHKLCLAVFIADRAASALSVICLSYPIHSRAGTRQLFQNVQSCCLGPSTISAFESPITLPEDGEVL